MDISRIINGPDGQATVQETGARHSTPTSLGLLTKTLAQSPRIIWTLPARIRHKDKDDIVFVGEDFIQIKQIEKDGHLTHIATKSDFETKIMSAKILGDTVQTYDDEDDCDIKVEDLEMSDCSYPESTKLPPQCLVLALATQQLVFLFACEDSNGFINFEFASNVPLPAFEHPHQQLGKHLAVDPKSRAMAVAAAQDNVFLYSVQPTKVDAKWGPGYLPISCERPLARIRGTIEAMEFLYPSDEDPENVILLLVVVRDGKTSLIRFDWLYSAGIQTAHCHKAIVISKGPPIPNLLIPVKSSGAFILAQGPEVSAYKNILSGSVQVQKIDLPDPGPQHPGSSPLMPRWVAWTRPIRNEGPDDHLYLAREDGDVFYLVLNRKNPTYGSGANHVSHFGCNIESAFTCYGNREQTDIFAICADMSVGGIHSINPPQSSKSLTGADLVSRLPNWTPTSDLVASNLPRNSDGTTRPRDALFTPGCRQPYGTLSELRFGIEARLGASFDTTILPGIVQLWTLPIEDTKELMVLLTSPSDSRMLRIPANVSDIATDHSDQPSISEVFGDVGLDFESRTLAAGVILDDCILQITERGISVSQSGQQRLMREDCPPQSRISAAAIEEEHGIAVTVTTRGGQSYIDLVQVVEDTEQACLRHIAPSISSDKTFVSVVIFKAPFGAIAVLGTSDSSLLFYTLDPQRGPSFLFEHRITGMADTYSTCGDVIALLDTRQSRSAPVYNVMLLCGLRDGTLYALELCLTRGSTISASVSSSKRITLGFTSVKLNSDANERVDPDHGFSSLSAYATCGNGFFKIAWAGHGSQELSISDVWVSDANEPSLQQGAFTAFAMVPPVDFLNPLSQALISTSGSKGFITMLEHLPKVVPRSVKVEGSPNRAIYSHEYGCFVTVGTEYSLNPTAGQRDSGSRFLRPVIHFKAAAWEYKHRLDPGILVFSITEWSYKDKSGKKYANFLLGSGPIDGNSSERGAITLLSPILHNGAVNEVRTKRVKSLETPVYSLAPYGELGLVVCTGTWVYLYKYDPAERRFIERCRHLVGSPGVYVTSSPPLIRISTIKDSLITLRHDPRAETLEPIGLDSRERIAVHHLSLEIPHTTGPASSQSMVNHISQTAALNIVTTRNRRIVGQTAPASTSRSISRTVGTLFEATLPQSMIRLKQANIRPPWKPATVPGVLEDKLVGMAVDGTITGLAILDPGLAHRLRWVQRLCERSAKICPMAPRHSKVQFDDILDDEEDFALPPLGFDDGAELVVGRVAVRPEHMHVNGDILQRLMERGGAAYLRQMMEDEAEGKDRLGHWMEENLEAQLGLVEMLAKEVKSVLDRWW